MAETKSLSPRGVLRFGVYQVNLPARELRKHGVRVRLPGQPFCILSMLLEKPGEIVTREEMRQRLWASDTFVDFEHSLNSAVKKLRAALGDTPENSRYIETVPRAGYRFIAPIDESLSSTSLEYSAGTTSESLPKAAKAAADLSVKPRRPVWIRIVSVAAGVAATVGAFVLYPLIAPRPPRLVRATQLTTSGRIEPWASIVSDGARVYFLEREGDHWNLMQTSISGGESQPVAAPFRNTRIFDISPDRSEFLIAPFSARTGNLALWIWPVQGGVARRVGEVAVDEAVWCPAGRRILFAKGEDLFLVNRDGTGLQKFLTVAGVPQQFRWSPDGRRLQFTLVDEEHYFVSRIWEVSADGTGLHQVLPGRDQQVFQGSGAWSSDGKYFLYVSRSNEVSNIFALREKGAMRRNPALLTQGPMEFSGIVFPPKPSRALAYGFRPEAELVRYDLKAHEITTLLPGSFASSFVLSPDREWLVFYQGLTLWRSRPDGSERLQLTFPPMLAADSSWLPGGRELLFACAWPGVLGKICTVPSAGGKVKVVLSGPDAYSDTSLSPDGQSFAYALNPNVSPQSGRRKAVCIYSLTDHSSSCLPHSEDLRWPRWSPDGHAILAGTGNQQSLAIFDLRKHEWKEIARGTVLLGDQWSPDSRWIYFQDILEPGEPIYRYRVADGKKERLASFERILRSGVQRCALSYPIESDGSLPLLLSRSYADIYALDLDLP